MIRRLIPLVAVVILVAACSPEEAELTTTTTTAPSESTTTAPDADETTSTEAEDDADDGDGDGVSEPAISDYDVVVRSSGTAGETLWILIDPGDYTDIDLENLIRELVDESDVTLAGIRVFDDLDALEAGRVDSEARTDDEQALVDEHFLVSLVDGAIIRFEGPYSEFGETAVGS